MLLGPGSRELALQVALSKRETWRAGGTLDLKQPILADFALDGS